MIDVQPEEGHDLLARHSPVRGLMDSFLQDVRYALRAMRRAPGLTAVVLLTTALGVGANTTIFAVVYAALLRPLPYPRADRLVMATDQSPANILEWQRQSRSFEAMAALRTGPVDVTGLDQPVRVEGAVVTGEFFNVMGVPPALGRSLAPTDDGRGAKVAVIADAFWRQRLGGSPDVIGATILLNGQPHTVIGVMPPGFKFPEEIMVWVAPRYSMPTHPLQPEQDPAQLHGSHYLGLYARLKPDVTRAAAQAEQQAIFEQLRKQHPNEVAADEVNVPLVPLREWLIGDVRPALLLLLGAVGLVLLIACANIANLLLARAAVRRQEITIRTALGASRGRISRQMITESVVLAVAGGASGALCAAWLLPALVALSPYDVQSLQAGVTVPVLAFALALSILTGVLFGCVPALQVSRDQVGSIHLRSRSSDPPGGRRIRRTLIVGEIALSVALLAGAGLMIRSFVELRGVSPGFHAAGLEKMRVDLPNDRYDSPERQSAFFDQLLANVSALPGVQRAAAAARLPFAGGNSTRSIMLDTPDARSDAWGGIRVISASYFEVMGIAIHRGRAFSEADRARTVPVAIVNETMARLYWPGADALGHRFQVGKDGRWLEIVGVAADIKHSSLRDAPAPEFYQPYRQAPWSFMHVIVRSSLGVDALGRELSGELRRIDPLLPSTKVESLEGLLAGSVSFDRFEMLALTMFAGTALCLAAVGLYGVMSFVVSYRAREIGVRIALGASASEIQRLVLGEGAALTAAGLAAGLLLAVASTNLLRAWLFGVSPLDPWTFALVVIVLATVSLAASWIPARRAIRTDPVVALRAE
ncbi:MAG TPA: ABC transporter permease [Vicinamibacterales bacterium]|nr:ABC transporter permease [Vicinamibacterales bacterium]